LREAKRGQLELAPSIFRVPVTKAMFGALQRTDPRCKSSDQVSAEHAEALRQLGGLIKVLTEKKQ
jgi:hypothetical protein